MAFDPVPVPREVAEAFRTFMAEAVIQAIAQRAFSSDADIGAVAIIAHRDGVVELSTTFVDGQTESVVL